MKSADILCVGRHNFFETGSWLGDRFSGSGVSATDFFIEPFSSIFVRYVDYLCVLRRVFGKAFLHEDSRLFFVLWGLSAADLSETEKSRLLGSFSGHAFLPCEYALCELSHFSLPELRAILRQNEAEKMLFYADSDMGDCRVNGIEAFFNLNPEIWVVAKILQRPLELLLNEEQFISIMERAEFAFWSCFSKIWLFRFSEKTAVVAEQKLREILPSGVNFELIPADAPVPSVWYPEVLPGFICGSASMQVLDFFAWRLQRVMRCAADYDIFSFPGGWRVYGDGSEKKEAGSEFMPAPVFMLDDGDVAGFSRRLEEWFGRKIPEFDSEKGLNGFMEYLVGLKKILPVLELEFVDFAVFAELYC